MDSAEDRASFGVDGANVPAEPKMGDMVAGQDTADMDTADGRP